MGVARGQRRVRRGVVHLQTEDVDGSAIAVRGSASRPDPHADHGGWATRSAADRREGPAQVVADDATLGLRAPPGAEAPPFEDALRAAVPWPVGTHLRLSQDEDVRVFRVDVVLEPLNQNGQTASISK